MRKIHVITQKEAIKEEKLIGCTAIVIDVFLATSTIAFLLENNYSPVYAVKDKEEALARAAEQKGEFILLGETKGESIEGFRYPDPCLIDPCNSQQAAIICSTNGTRAIEKAANAKTLFISSLVNGHMIAEQIHAQSDESSIVLVCSGNDDRFSMEDFVGAGQIVGHLIKKGDYMLSDAAKLAESAYKSSLANGFKELFECETAELLRRFDFENSMELVIRNHECLFIIPAYEDGKIIDLVNKVKSGSIYNTSL